MDKNVVKLNEYLVRKIFPSLDIFFVARFYVTRFYVMYFFVIQWTYRLALKYPGQRLFNATRHALALLSVIFIRRPCEDNIYTDL